jgi:clan AA aspartic protease
MQYNVDMSIVHTEITLKNGGDVTDMRRGRSKEPEIRQVTVTAMVDTGAWTLIIDEATRKKLGLEILGTEPTTLADGSKEFYQLAGPLEVCWQDRRTSCDALVLPDADEVLLGAIPLEAMDLTVHPRLEKVVGAHGDQVVHMAKGGVKNH